MSTPLLRERTTRPGSEDASLHFASPPHPLASPAPFLVTAHFPFHQRSEQLRMLRTELLLRHEGGTAANLIAVVSAHPQEGRSQLAAELAISFAQLGQPTLLVDADLRTPRQHELFEARNDRGLASALAHDGPTPTQAVAGLPSLSLLTAGPLPSNPLELLCDSRFEQTVDEWRARYSYVVIDTPPVVRFADALAVATITGHVLSVTRAKRTPYRDTRDMLRRLAATRARALGAVINHF